MSVACRAFVIVGKCSGRVRPEGFPHQQDHSVKHLHLGHRHLSWGAPDCRVFYHQQDHRVQPLHVAHHHLSWEALEYRWVDPG
ncbi:hypothetical protein HPB52_018090 [Rhipicephalus sanguineus]|uniref:Uncharacterized protein n=1 Tax=Rhipicephalus sanguineus TaxID=34632 RepID=A0A9D4T442_RHISA|nr:hypothetical protein HPB52_018090 [Rhipicephalus sanguineus]